MVKVVNEMASGKKKLPLEGQLFEIRVDLS